MLADLPAQRRIDQLRTMLLVRRFEEALIELATRVDVGHFHTYIGQETTGVPALDLLEAGDLTFTTHRNHGHLLARGVPPGPLLAEILGRATGTNQGKGGTLHLASAVHGFPATSASVGGSIPLATGAAFAFARRHVDRVSVCLIGDGALEEGAWHEAANIAMLEKLPVIYVCENNSVESLGGTGHDYPSSSMAAAPLTALAEVFGMPASALDGTDTGAVHVAMAGAIERGRAGGGPSFIEARTVRWPGNRSLWAQQSTAVTDVRMAWTPDAVPDEHRDWYTTNDCVLAYVRELLMDDQITHGGVETLDHSATTEIAQAVRFALASPFPDPAAAMTDVFA